MQVSISLPRSVIDWLDEKGKGRSEVIQKALISVMKKEALDNPSSIRKELNEIEETLSEINIRRGVLINKLSYHAKSVEQKSLKEMEEISKQLKKEKKWKRDKLKFVGRIPDINNILKGAFTSPSKFNYFSAVDKIRKIDEFRLVDVSSLKLYVESRRGSKS